MNQPIVTNWEAGCEQHRFRENDNNRAAPQRPPIGHGASQ